MPITYIIIWAVLILLFKYDLKQNNSITVIRATLFTLLSYIVLNHSFQEGLSLQVNTNSDNLIQNQLKTYKHKNGKKACNFLKESKAISIANFNSAMMELPKMSDSTFSSKTDMNEIASIYNTKLDTIQNVFDNLTDVKTAYDNSNCER
tara:strand:- start:176 stop:622 length:447 start_codon:yes stop_codon:yes gene_type:complete